jgi:hypothetical protein
MSPGQWPPRMVMDVPVLVTQANRVTIMSTDAQVPQGTMYAPPETEASFEEIER